VYPLLVTGIANVAFPGQAEGSLVERDGKAVGSTLIGQPFSDPKYFWSRPSATVPMPYNAAASSGSNQGPLNPALADAVKGRIEALRAADPGNTAPVPIDLVTASGSASTRTSARPRPTTKSRGSRRCATSIRRESVPWWPSTPRARQFGFLGERG